MEHIVAPYEADAQMAYLQKEGLVELVITEDSDLLAFGCQKVCVRTCVRAYCWPIAGPRVTITSTVLCVCVCVCVCVYVCVCVCLCVGLCLCLCE